MTALANAKEDVAVVKAELERRYSESAKRFIAEAGKTHGTATLPLQDGMSAKIEIKQTVKWDSAKLQAVARELPWERVEAMFKIAFSMPEAIYKGIAALSPEMRQKIDAARTTVISEPSIVLTRTGE